MKFDISGGIFGRLWSLFISCVYICINLADVSALYIPPKHISLMLLDDTGRFLEFQAVGAITTVFSGQRVGLGPNGTVVTHLGHHRYWLGRMREVILGIIEIRHQSVFPKGCSLVCMYVHGAGQLVCTDFIFPSRRDWGLASVACR